MDTGGDALAPSLEVLNITHHSVELAWHTLSHDQSHDPEAGRSLYTVQEEEVGKGRGFSTIYSGYSSHCLTTGLGSLTQYRYRIRVSSNVESGPWSEPLTVTTTRQPKSAEQLHRAIERGDVDATQHILEASPHYLNIPDIYGLSPLMHASRLGNTNITQLLLDLGADIEYCNKAGKTSLMEAAYNGHLECVKQLVERGASWNTADQSGMSALHWAVDGGNVVVVQYALSEGARADEVSHDTIARFTPLLKIAALSGNAAVARVLIEHGAYVNKQNADGQTALILAALGGHEELVRVLLGAGADPAIANPHGQTALDIATAMDKKGVVEVLEEHRSQQQEKQSSEQ